MLFRIAKQAPYLYRHSQTGSFYFRRRLPTNLFSHTTKREIKLSLRTSNRTAAILLHDRVLVTLNKIFSIPDLKAMNDILKNLDLEKLRRFEADSIVKNTDGSFEIKGFKSDPNNPHNDIEILKAMGFIQRNSEPVTSTTPSPKNNGLRFSELADKFLNYAQLGIKAEGENRAIFQTFIELYDDPLLTEIDHSMLTNFVETIQNNIPANAKKSYPNLTSKQIAKLNHSGKRMMSAHSINKYIGRVGLAFKYGVNHGLISENFAEGKRVKDPEKARDKRRPFTISELKTLFETTKFYRGFYKKSKNQDLFFLHLIGAFQGMRLSEICQLQPEDIRQEDGVWVFDINDNHELKSCKTSGSKRLVPVHDELLKTGIIDFVSDRKSQEFLFKWRYHEKNGWSHFSSKDSSNYIRNIAKIQGQTFHCFRHNVADCLMKNRLVSKELQEAILGHAQEGESYGRYGKGFSVEELHEAINQISYVGLSLEHLYILTPISLVN